MFFSFASLFTVFSSFPMIIGYILEYRATAAGVDQATDGELFVQKIVNGKQISDKPGYLLFTAPYKLCDGGCEDNTNNFAFAFPLYIGRQGKEKYKQLYQRDYHEIHSTKPKAPFKEKTTRYPFTLCRKDKTTTVSTMETTVSETETTITDSPIVTETKTTVTETMASSTETTMMYFTEKATISETETTLTEIPTVCQTVTVIDAPTMMYKTDAITTLERDTTVTETPTVLELETIVTETPTVLEPETVVTERPTVFETETTVTETPTVTGTDTTVTEIPTVLGTEITDTEIPTVLETETTLLESELTGVTESATRSIDKLTYLPPIEKTSVEATLTLPILAESTTTEVTETEDIEFESDNDVTYQMSDIQEESYITNPDGIRCPPRICKNKKTTKKVTPEIVTLASDTEREKQELDIRKLRNAHWTKDYSDFIDYSEYD